MFVRFYSRMFSIYSIDGASGRHKMVSQIIHLILSTGFHGHGVLAQFIAYNVHCHSVLA